ncbi:MAG: glycosyltransferase family 2 protein [Negativicutes bacterium]|nr:glycosyltransferase family 2 protein [Negativicutes bacterium]
MDKLTIVIPAYNEEANIAKVIEDWHPIVAGLGPDSRLVVLNDGSRDNTSQVATALRGRFPQLEVVDKPNSGHGPTCLYGYKYAIAAGADYVFQTDSDGQTVPGEFEAFWRCRRDFNFVIGVRENRQDGLSRKVVTTVLKAVLFVTFGAYVRDANTPFRLMNAKTLAVYLEQIPEDFFLGNALLSAAIVKRKDTVKWIPVTFRPRQGGENSINLPRIFRIGIKSLVEFKHFIQTKRNFLIGTDRNADIKQ